MIDGGQTGSVGANDGVIHLVSAAAPGAVRIADAATMVGQRGEVRVTQSGSGERPTEVVEFRPVDIGSVDVGGLNGGGTIRIRGGQVVIDDAWIFADNYGSRDSTGGIDLQADHLVMRNGLITSDAIGRGKAGSVAVAAPELELHDGAKIASSTWGSGDAGQVTVTADRLDIHDSVIASSTFRSGDAGRITVNADRLLISDVNAAKYPSLITSSAEPNSTGRAGTVAVTARELELRNGGAIFSSTFASGDAGQVTVSADRLLISGDDATDFTGIASSNGYSSLGRAGMVAVTARELELRNGGQIFSSTWGARRCRAGHHQRGPPAGRGHRCGGEF